MVTTSLGRARWKIREKIFHLKQLLVFRLGGSEGRGIAMMLVLSG